MSTRTQLARSNSRGSDFELSYASPTVLRAKGADRESLVRHDSKKHRPRALRDEEGRLGNDGRKRRSRGSSDDDGKITEDGFSNEDLRVGGPYLCSIPVDSIYGFQADYLPSLNELRTSDGKRVRDCILDIISSGDIELYSGWGRGEAMWLCLRQSRFNPEPEPIPTIVIKATRQIVDNVWLDTARQIYSLLCHAGLGHISVDILDPQAEEPPITSPILDQDLIFHQWSSVLDGILRDIDREDIQVIECYRRGRSSNVTENPPTVLVIAAVNSKKNWKPTRDLITRILSQLNLPMVAVEIVKDRINLFRNTGFNKNLLSGQVMVGGPIASSRNRDQSGTLGGFIELLSPSSLTWKRFALTCFHVIDPHKEDVENQDIPGIEKWRRDGIPMLTRNTSRAERELISRNLQISHPSQLAKKEQIEDLQKKVKNQMAEPNYQHGLLLRQNDLFGTLRESKQRAWEVIQGRIDGYNTDIERIRDSFHGSGHILGSVVAASGYKTKKLPNSDHMVGLDWALIRVDESDRFSNKLGDGKVLREIASSETLSGLRKELDATLEFEGYRSGRHEVIYNGLETVNFMQGGKEIPTLEYSITGQHAHDFPAIRGDSGSLLFRAVDDAYVMGMIFGGLEHNKIEFFTRIDVLSSDIMEHTGAKGFRMCGS